MVRTCHVTLPSKKTTSPSVSLRLSLFDPRHRPAWTLIYPPYLHTSAYFYHITTLNITPLPPYYTPHISITPGLTVGGVYRASPRTTLKSKVNLAGVLATSIIHVRLRPRQPCTYAPSLVLLSPRLSMDA